jgi:bifunctional UDP-N-acetylglucosamine pyrophosphorylase/glucosamine-1-phosphate N-acetyltransferase
LNKRRALGAIVLAAGLGRRMRSARAKVLHHLGGRPLISYPLTALRRVGAAPVVVVVGHQREAVRSVCEPFSVRFAVQKEQKGTGHAALMARPALRGFAGDVFLVNGDLPMLRPESFRRLAKEHGRAGAAVSLLTATLPDAADFGRIDRDDSGRVRRIVEFRDAGPEERRIREINVGLYCVDAGFLFRALRRLRPANAQREIYLTDVVEFAVREGHAVGSASAPAEEGAQISSRVDLAGMEKMLRDEMNAKWMTRGVTIEDPATAYIGPDVVIGRDTTLGPNVILRGRTRIGENCRVDGSAYLTDSRIGDNVHVKFGVVMTDAVVADDVHVGPFAQLRPGTRLGQGVHIGNFVETKNAVLGAGGKANHLAYLGDARIGRDVNVGAGTITCNYDGFRKHQTTVGDRVQIGSDSQLVAPVRVGDDAYVATATTVRKDVAAGALVFNTRQQRERPGWVEARRKREGVGTPTEKPSATKRTRKRTGKRARKVTPSPTRRR